VLGESEDVRVLLADHPCGFQGPGLSKIVAKSRPRGPELGDFSLTRRILEPERDMYYSFTTVGSEIVGAFRLEKDGGMYFFIQCFEAGQRDPRRKLGMLVGNEDWTENRNPETIYSSSSV